VEKEILESGARETSHDRDGSGTNHELSRGEDVVWNS
jgi:hypothetical protein